MGCPAPDAGRPSSVAVSRSRRHSPPALRDLSGMRRTFAPVSAPPSAASPVPLRGAAPRPASLRGFAGVLPSLRSVRCRFALPGRGAARPPAAAPPAPRRGCRPLRRSGSPGSSSRAAPCGSGCAALRLRPSPSLRGAVAVGGVAPLPLAAGRRGALLGSRGAGGVPVVARRCAVPRPCGRLRRPCRRSSRPGAGARLRRALCGAPRRGAFGAGVVRAAARVTRALRRPLPHAFRRQLRRAAVRQGWPTREALRPDAARPTLA